MLLSGLCFVPTSYISVNFCQIIQLNYKKIVELYIRSYIIYIGILNIVKQRNFI